MGYATERTYGLRDVLSYTGLHKASLARSARFVSDSPASCTGSSRQTQTYRPITSSNTTKMEEITVKKLVR